MQACNMYYWSTQPMTYRSWLVRLWIWCVSCWHVVYSFLFEQKEHMEQMTWKRHGPAFCPCDVRYLRLPNRLSPKEKKKILIKIKYSVRLVRSSAVKARFNQTASPGSSGHCGPSTQTFSTIPQRPSTEQPLHHPVRPCR